MCTKEISLESKSIEDAFEEIGCVLLQLSAEKRNCPVVEFEDQGIGSYEFWGAKGNDSNVQPVWDDCSFELKVTNFKNVFDTFTKEIDEEIGKLIQTVNDEIRYTFTPDEGSDFEYFQDIDFKGVLYLDFSIFNDSMTFIVQWEVV